MSSIFLSKKSLFISYFFSFNVTANSRMLASMLRLEHKLYICRHCLSVTSRKHEFCFSFVKVGIFHFVEGSGRQPVAKWLAVNLGCSKLFFIWTYWLSSSASNLEFEIDWKGPGSLERPKVEDPMQEYKRNCRGHSSYFSSKKEVFYFSCRSFPIQRGIEFESKLQKSYFTS